MARFILLSLCLVGANGALANECPPSTVDEAHRQSLMESVLLAPDQRSAQLISNQLWEIWANAPDAHAQDLLDEGISRRTVLDLENALNAFEALVSYCPDYAEGYNQRAFINFIRQDYTRALVDLDAALALSPEHLGALTGRAMAFMALERNAEALRDLEAALALNPWLKERGLLPELRRKVGAQDI